LPAGGRIRAAAPWLVRRELPVRLEIADAGLVGSADHFVRFDLYPLHSPSTHGRHYGYWDLPLREVQGPSLELALDGKRLLARDARPPLRIRARWRRGLAWNGYCVLHTSLWDSRGAEPRQLEVASSQHVILPPGGDVGLEQIVYPITERCNLDCSWCRRRPGPGEELADLSEEVCAGVREGARRAHSVHAMYLGEPLLNPRLYEILRGLRGRLPRGGTLGLCSNAVLMDAAHSKRLLGAGLDYLFFHLDAATAATARRIRRGLDFEAAVGNMRGFMRLRGEAGMKRPWVTANFVIFEENREEIPAFLELAANLGLDAVRLALYRDDLTQTFVGLDPDRLGPLFERAREIAAGSGVALLAPALQRSSEPRCRFMQTVYVHPSGDVVPCCRWQPSCASFPNEPRVFGNVRRTPLAKIWKIPEYREFRRRVLTGDLPDSCDGCDLLTGLLA
jgi:MoaA/NifB/PqqE/SkfB family radical SAM enzyme